MLSLFLRQRNMSGVLHQARILSSETDNTIKQQQETNVNINIKPPQRCQSRAQSIPLYPNPQPWSKAPGSIDPLNPNVNFTKANHPNSSVTEEVIAQQVGQTMYIPTRPSVGTLSLEQSSQSQSQPPIDKAFPLIQERGMVDLSAEIEDIEKKNQFLELVIEMYETNPLKINSYVVCKSSLLMNMIKLLTECEKVDLVIDDSDVGCGCGASSAKILKIDKILVTKDGKTEELKYCYNNIYTEFIKYGISLKLCSI